VTLLVRTANLHRVQVDDGLDITASFAAEVAESDDLNRYGAREIGRYFSPSPELLYPFLRKRRQGAEDADTWERYRVLYIAEMRESYRRHRPAWLRLLGWKTVTLQCMCDLTNGSKRCHRIVLAEDVLLKLGAAYAGEIEPPPRTKQPRHSWEHPEAHIYVCKRCSLMKENVLDEGQWLPVWRWIDGRETRGGSTPPCVEPVK